MKLRIGDRVINAHKIILARCSYFQGMFNSQMREAHSSEVRIEEINEEVMLSILYFLYTD